MHPSSTPPTPPRRLLARPRSRLALALAALPLGLLVCEAAVRLGDLAPPVPPRTEGGVFKPSDDPLLVYQPGPLTTKVTTYYDRDGAPLREVEHAVNALGYRGPEVSLKKPDGVLRIACVGDSHTFGDGVRVDQTWPAHLERMLEDAWPGHEVQALNFGVGGYDTAQEVIWMRRTALPFQPDIVILQMFVNDASPRTPGPSEEGVDAVLAWTSPRGSGVLRAVRDRVRSLDLLLDSVYRRHALGVFGETRGARFADGDPGWEGVQGALREARDGLEGRGIRFGVALYPFLVADGGHLTSHRAFEVVKAFCASEGIDCIDTESDFLGRDLAQLRISPHDYHGNGEAHRIFARAVAGRLLTDEPAE